MTRPNFINQQDIDRWDQIIDEDPHLPKQFVSLAEMREVCYAGLYLCEELDRLACPPEYIFKIQYTAGKMSFGRDPWEVHQQMLESYKLNQVEFELDPDQLN